MGAGASCLSEETPRSLQMGSRRGSNRSICVQLLGKNKRFGERTVSHTRGRNTSAVQQALPSQPPLRATAPRVPQSHIARGWILPTPLSMGETRRQDREACNLD